ncbi:DUF624 domain-containing protein [Saccharibacillus sp. CPCC 101409]|uniref:YesL family protein n=1 Tax=Saccharibacillus sp. CPCC 101409 TaxID=3058041 RepID=UPI002672A19E|nr:DUF624 domain-containing protein [Saccharibacillus sp. CPCC 101409]MDO3410904.1 DUF624 domain-containing protein [Saccharibacillus sp. CPCC 101409]
MEFRGLTGGIYRLTEWIMRLSGTNILWVICSLPFLFIVYMRLAIQPEFVNEALTLNWALGILAPVTLFPATSAMFTVVRKWVMGEPDVKIMRTFFRGYKDNYKQSLVGGIFYTILFVVMYVDITVYMVQFRNLQLFGILMLILMILLFVSLFNFFSMVTHYHMKIGGILKNAILLTLLRPFRVFSTLLGAVAVLYIGWRMPVLYFFFAGSIMAWFAFFNFYATFLKMQEQAKKREEEQTSDTESELIDLGKEKKEK